MKKFLLTIVVLISTSTLYGACIEGTIYEIDSLSTGTVKVALKKTGGNRTSSYPLAGTGDALKTFTANIMSAQARGATVYLCITSGQWNEVKVR